MALVNIVPIQIGEHTVIGVEVLLPKTTLLSISTNRGYIMCGARNVLPTALSERNTSDTS